MGTIFIYFHPQRCGISQALFSFLMSLGSLREKKRREMSGARNSRAVINKSHTTAAIIYFLFFHDFLIVYSEFYIHVCFCPSLC